MLSNNGDAPLLLVVEDDPNHGDLIRRSLDDATESYRLELVESLRDARRFLDQQTPDLILTDYRLPDGEGSELVAVVKDTCPVVLLTSQGNEQVAVNAMKAGVLDYVIKSSAVFSGMSRIAQRGLRDWGLIQENRRAEQESKRMEQQLLYIQKLESLVTMSSGIAHDFNNLLQVVLGNLELSLMKTPQNSPFYKYLINASDAAERASKLSNMLLDYSGKGFLNKRELNLNSLIENNRSLISAAAHSGTFIVELADRISVVLADAEQIQQVIMNLVINASEAIEGTVGEIRLTTGSQEYMQSQLNTSMLEERVTPGWYVWVEVRDTGCGMDRDTVNRVFDPFFTTKFTGRGMGMAAAQGIIRAHKGTILISSSLGKGTTVRFLLPIATT